MIAAEGDGWSGWLIIVGVGTSPIGRSDLPASVEHGVFPGRAGLDPCASVRPKGLWRQASTQQSLTE